MYDMNFIRVLLSFMNALQPPALKVKSDDDRGGFVITGSGCGASRPGRGLAATEAGA